MAICLMFNISIIIGLQCKMQWRLFLVFTHFSLSGSSMPSMSAQRSRAFSVWYQESWSWNEIVLCLYQPKLSSQMDWIKVLCQNIAFSKILLMDTNTNFKWFVFIIYIKMLDFRCKVNWSDDFWLWVTSRLASTLWVRHRRRGWSFRGGGIQMELW